MIFFNIISDILIYILNYLGIYNEIVLYNISGIFEVIEGVKNFTTIKNLDYTSLFNTIIYISILLGFSGISVIFQIKNELKNTDVKLNKLIISKIIHGILSGIITYILLSSTNVLESDILNVYSNIEIDKEHICNMYTVYINSLAVLLFSLSALLLIKFNLKKKINISKFIDTI